MPPLALDTQASRRYLQQVKGLFKAEIYISRLVDNTKVVCKDYSRFAHNPVTAGLARYLAKREFKALQRLQGWGFAPSARLSSDGFILLQEYIPGQVLSNKPTTNPCKTYTALSQALAELHERGIAHNDIRANNIILRPDGRPILIDFTAAMVWPAWLSWSWTRRKMFNFDDRHLVKIKRQLGCPLNAEDLAFLRRPAWLEAILSLWKDKILPSLKASK